MPGDNFPFVSSQNGDGTIRLDGDAYLGLLAADAFPAAFGGMGASGSYVVLDVQPAVVDPDGVRRLGKTCCGPSCRGCDDSARSQTEIIKCVTIPPPPPPPPPGGTSRLPPDTLSKCVFPGGWFSSIATTTWSVSVPAIGARGPLRWYDSVSAAFADLPTDPGGGYVYFLVEVTGATEWTKLGDMWVPATMTPPGAILAIPANAPT